MRGTRVYCLDASAAALLSEDWQPSRLHFQRELVACHSGAPARQPAGDITLIAAAGGRAQVAMHPCGEAAELRRALDGVQAAGDAHLAAALKLSLLTSRRFSAGSTHVTAFVASPSAAASLDTAAAASELRQRFVEAAIGLDVAVLCRREELGEQAAAALEALAGGSSSSGSGGEGAEPAPSAIRLLWLEPAADGAEPWQQLEPVLEQLEGGLHSSGADPADGSADASSSSSGSSSSGGSQAAPPQRSSFALRRLDPLSNPRTALLSARSGVQQPAQCRGESLNRLMHLSSDGLARPWLPTYASIGQQAAAKARAAGAAGGGLGAATGGGGGMCYIEVQPIPKWRTLLKAAAGRMLASSEGSGRYAAASSELLRSLETLSVLDEPERAGDEGSDEGSPAAAATAAAPPVRYRPDGGRGVLRLLQGTKEPHLLKLVWSRLEQPGEAEAGGSSPRKQPLDMFAADAAAGGRAGAAGSASSALLGFMPAAAVSASAARGPIVVEGCELWEAAAEWEWELPLQLPESAAAAGSEGAARRSVAPESSAEGSSAPPAAPAAVEARQLPNGAELLLLTPSRVGHPARSDSSSGSSSSSSSRPSRPQVRTAAAFWLQQRLQPGDVEPPAYATADSLPAAASAASASAPGEAQAGAAAEQAQGPAALVAAALQRHVRQPPRVDLRRLRKDVKSGVIEVTPITVGPLPAQFVADIVSTRSALMGRMGVDNLDSWDEEAGGGASASAGGARQAGAEAGSSSGAGGGAGSGLSPEAAAQAMSQHKAAVLSLLRQRLGRQRDGKGGSAAAKSGAPPAAAEEPAATDAAQAVEAGPADDAVTEPAGGAGSPSRAIPCGTPQQAAQPAGSYVSEGTPFGTPFSILPSLLRGPGGSEGGGAADGDAGRAAAAGGEHEEGPLLPPKREGSAVLLGTASQGEGGDGDHLFQLE